MGYIEGVKLCANGHCLSHLLFANDTLIFLKARRSNCQNVVKILDAYCKAFGQEVNLQKSIIYFGANTPKTVWEELCRILRMPNVDDPGRYLGVPALWGCSKDETLGYVKERILRKIQGWKKWWLFQAGRAILIKAVAQAVSSYPMSVFKFPNNLCKEIDAALAKFWWR
ncbi:hypothetical protein ACFX1X_000168 [Malus domestica]